MRAAFLSILLMTGCEASHSTPDVKAEPAADGEVVAPAAGACALDLDKLAPLGSTVHLTRYPDQKAEFSVLAACGGDAALRVYWFLDFDLAKPKKWDSEADPFVLKACDSPGDFQALHVVEAVVTTGQLDISAVDTADPRYTQGGEALTLVRWFVTVDGAGSGCAASSGR